MKQLIAISCMLSWSLVIIAQKPVPVKPRILISTDIGGTDPDDNQSMIYFLMYSNLFNTEGLISSPSYGHGTKQKLGRDWYTDRDDPQLYDGNIQGGITIKKWRREVLQDWATRWAWLKQE